MRVTQCNFLSTRATWTTLLLQVLEQQDLPHKQTAIYQLHSILLPLDSANPRDNSTGFTIQWGKCTPKSWFNYPRSFNTSYPPIGGWLSNGKSARGVEANSFNNSGATMIESGGGAVTNANSIAYIVVGFS